MKDERLQVLQEGDQKGGGCFGLEAGVCRCMQSECDNRRCEGETIKASNGVLTNGTTGSTEQDKRAETAKEDKDQG